MVDPIADLTDEELLAYENKKRPKTERELKREVAHASAEGAAALVALLRANMDSEMLCWRVPRALRELAIKDEGARKECVDQVKTRALRCGAVRCGAVRCGAWMLWCALTARHAL